MDKYEKAIETKRIKYWVPYPQWFVDELVDPEDKRRAVEGFISGDMKLTFHCPVHDVDYVQRVGDHIKRKTGLPNKTGCHQCAVEKKIMTKHGNGYLNVRPQWFVDDLMYDEDKKAALEGTLSSFQKLWFVCSNGHEYEQWGYDHIRNGEPNCGCPICNCGTHRGSVEEELQEYYKQKYNVICNTKKLVQSPTGRAMEVDMYFPDYNFAVEVDGAYWHQEIYDTYDEYLEDINNKVNGTYRVGKWKGYTKWKDDKCAEKGINLIHVDPSEGFEICRDKIDPYLI